MLTGPQNMPKFSDRQLSPEEKRDIVAYVREAAQTPTPGGLDWRLRADLRRHGRVDRRNGGHHRRRTVDRSTGMSDKPDEKGTDVPGHKGEPGQPTDAELAKMTQEELLELGGKLDGVEIVYKEPRWPIPGTKAEKRAERTVAYWFLLAGFSGLALLLIFLFWPWGTSPTGPAASSCTR